MTHANSCERQEAYYVEGMHCPGCELRIEKKLSKLTGVKAVDANARTGEVRVRRQGARASAAELTAMFSHDGYVFSDRPTGAQSRRNPWAVGALSLVLIGAFVLVGKSGLSSMVQVDARSTLGAFFAFGLLAGASVCAALVGGLVLSMSRQWQAECTGSDSWLGRAQPHLLFNAGRLVGFTLLGAILGTIGARLRLSVTVSALLVAVVSVWMLVLGLQMLGVRGLQGVQFRLPKVFTRYAADESNFRGRYTPALLGALTFILPCGFTLTAQSLALLSGSAVQGGLIMLFFALGTLPMLLGIGLSSTKLLAGRGTASYFMPVAGVLIIFFAVYNLNSQVNVLGWTSLSDLALSSPQPAAASATRGEASPALPTLAGGKQVIQMDASAYGYSPRWFRVKAGMPVRWEINDVGTSGCTNAVISRRLFSDAVELTPGAVSVKEFTPQQPGVYKFSCWMGMVWGVIEVVS